ncbi:hypothetical protein [Amphibacillus sediminis]|uniref:hypothetical protein n=1 Tax=Amphibacillus sediminis TaxID=360185 RepID=UPI0008309F1C|nr:hypothetical protein [Amphibacillus sediminis]
MKKQKVNYCLRRNFFSYPLIAKREMPFEVKLIAQLVMDALVSEHNKANFDRKINKAIDSNDPAQFKRICEQNKHYSWEY